MKLAFDIDGTLANVIPALQQRIYRDWGIVLPEPTRHDFFEQICEPGYFEPFLDYFFSILENHYLGIEPYPDSDIIYQYQPVTFITARKHDLLPSTEGWIRYWFPNLDFIIYQSRSRYKIDLLEQLGFDGIVEDRLQTANQVAEKGLVCYLVNRNWNIGRWTHHNVIRINSLIEIKKEETDNNSK